MGVRAKYLKKLFTSDLKDEETRKQARTRLWNEANSEYMTELHNNTQTALNNYLNLNKNSESLNLISPYEEIVAGGNQYNYDRKPKTDIYQNYQKSVEQKDLITRDLLLKVAPNISDNTETNNGLRLLYNDRIAGYNLAFKQSFEDNPEVSVTDMLQRLKKAGFYKGEIDGLWGPKSLQAYAEYLKWSLNPTGDVLQGGPNWIDFINKTTAALGGPVARAMNLRYYHLDLPLVHLSLFESQNGAPSSIVRLVETLADPVASVANPSGINISQTTELQPANTTNNQTSLKNWNYKTADNKNIDLSQFSFGNGDWWKPQEYTPKFRAFSDNNDYVNSTSGRKYYTDAAGNVFYYNADGSPNYGRQRTSFLSSKTHDEFGAGMGNLRREYTLDKAREAFKRWYILEALGNPFNIDNLNVDNAFDQWLYNTTGKHQWEQFKQGGIMKKRIGSYLSGGQVSSEDDSEEFLTDLAKIVGVEPNQIGAVIQKLGKKNVLQLYHIWGNAKEANKLDKDAGKKAIIAAIQGSQSSGRLQTSGPEQIAYNAPPSAQLGRMGLRFHELQGTCPEGYEIEKYLPGGCVKCRNKAMLKASEMKCGGKPRIKKNCGGATIPVRFKANGGKSKC